MMNVSFFGEVNELKSRALLWSDSEEEQNGEDDAADDQMSISMNANVDRIKCDFVYITLTKNIKSTGNNLDKIGEIVLQETQSSSFGAIFLVDSKDIWLQINENCGQLKNDSLRKAIRMFLVVIKEKIDYFGLIIISNEYLSNSTNEITYLSNSKELIEKIDLKNCKPFLAPSMVKNLIEASVFEISTIFNIKCCVIKFPDTISTNLGSKLIPSSILSCLKNDLIAHNSNVYI